MKELFLNVLNLSMTASWLILAVLLVRILLKKAPKWIMVMLWGIVAFRLVCPFSIESLYSLIPASLSSGEVVSEWKNHYVGEVIISHEQSEHYEEAVEAGIDPIIDNTGSYYVVTKADELSEPATVEDSIIPVLADVWLIGIVLLSLYSIISYWRLHRKVDTAVLYMDNIYQSENISSPFLCGIVKPRIYMPFHINEDNIEYVIAHEKAHLHRKDHWWKIFGFILLTIHWFNPLMWTSYILLCRDIELACDESVIKNLTNEKRAGYSQALLLCSIHSNSILTCPIAFGEIGVKERIKSIHDYKRPTVIRIGFALLLCIIVALCFITIPKNNKLFTHQELVQMPAMELYDLFLKNGLKLPDHYLDGSEESIADYLKENFDTLSQGFVVASYTAHREFAQSVKEVYDKITYPPGVRIIENRKLDGNQKEAGYKVEINLSKIPLSHITGEIKELQKTIAENYEKREPWSSVHPGYSYKEFRSSEEAMKYIGVKQLRSVNWNLQEQKTNVSTFGNKKGEIEHIVWEDTYELGTIQMQTTATIYTDKYAGELTTGMTTTENLEFYATYLYTASHTPYLTIDSTKTESGNYTRDSLLVLDDVLYRLSMAYQEEDIDNANEILKEWANLLDSSVVYNSTLPTIFFDEFGMGENAYSNFCLSSYYNTSADIDLEELFYNGFNLPIEESDRRFLRTQNANMDYDIIKLPREKMDDVLRKYFGIILEDTNYVGIEKFYYDLNSDIYYLVHSDSHQWKIYVKEQYIGKDGNLHVVYTRGMEYGDNIAILKKDGENYYFQANYKVNDYNKVMYPISEIEQIENLELKEWINNVSKLNLEQYYLDYNGEKLQQIVIDDALHNEPSTYSNIIFYRSDIDESIENAVANIIDFIMKLYTEENNGLSYKITDYMIEEQKIITLENNVYLIPYLDVYMKYDGTGFAGTMENYMEAEPGLCKDGYMPLIRQGNAEVFMYILMEHNGVYRLQRLEDIVK